MWVCTVHCARGAGSPCSKVDLLLTKLAHRLQGKRKEEQPFTREKGKKQVSPN